MTTHPWPALPLAEWKDAYDTLHRWTQIIGMIKLTPIPLIITGGMLLYMSYLADLRYLSYPTMIESSR